MVKWWTLFRTNRRRIRIGNYISLR